MKNSENNGKARQLMTAIIVNLLCLSYGVSVGWPSPTIPQLRSNEPPIDDTPMSENQTSWISGLLAVGGLLTIPFCGILSEHLGRKKFALLSGLPHIISWIFIIFGQNHIYIFVARLFVGIGGAMTFFVVPIYVSEIANEDIRGILGSLLLFSVNIGILVAYIAGAFLSYRLFASLSLLFPVIFLTTFAFMPETPVYLVRRNRHLQAHKSLMFLQGNNRDLVEQELLKLRSQSKTCNTSSNKIKLGDFFKDRATQKGLIISVGLIAGQQLSGIFAVLSYAETIFKRAGSSISSEIASIIIALIQIVGSYASTMLMDRAGRRLLTLISCFGMAISLSIVALFFYLQENKYDVSSFLWLPLIALSTYIVTYCLGIGPVPFVVISEVFSQDVSSFATNMCFIFYWIIMLTAIRTFDLSMQFLGADGCFFILSIFCAVCFIFTYYLLPETKGRKREDIVDGLAGNREKTDVVNRKSESKNLRMDESV